jgi:glycosyltransferase involved in cell wall biosynthesis
MLEAPTITVITPVFNADQFIKETVESVLLAAKDFNIEYIVVDDGSSDLTLEILQEFGSKIKLISQPNAGESAAVNTGLKNARGEFALVVSADDPLFTPEIFKGVEDFFMDNPGVVAWYPDWRMIDEKGSVIKSISVEEYSEEKLLGWFLCLPGPGAIFRKTLAQEIGGRDSRWKFVGDYDFWLRLSQRGDLKKRNQTLAQWRLHDDSSSIAMRGKLMHDERIAVIKHFLDHHRVDKRIARMALANSYYRASLLTFYSEKIPGRRDILKAIWVRRGIPEAFKIHHFLFIFLLPLSKNVYNFLQLINQRLNGV